MQSRPIVVLVIGMFLAAVVGVVASFAMQFLMPETEKNATNPDVAKAVEDVVKDETHTLERNLRVRLESIATSIDSLSARISDLEKKVEEMVGRSVVAGAPKTAEVESGGENPTVNVPLDEETLKRLVEEIEKRREEVRAERRAQWMAGMQQRFVEAIKNRIEELGKSRNWDINKEEAVKAILDEQSRKIAELFKGGIREETFAKMREIMDETRRRLSEILTEKEMNELFSGFRGPFRRRRPPLPNGGSGRQPEPPR